MELLRPSDLLGRVEGEDDLGHAADKMRIGAQPVGIGGVEADGGGEGIWCARVRGHVLFHLLDLPGRQKRLQREVAEAFAFVPRAAGIYVEPEVGNIDGKGRLRVVRQRGKRRFAGGHAVDQRPAQGDDDVGGQGLGRGVREQLGLHPGHHRIGERKPVAPARLPGLLDRAEKLHPGQRETVARVLGRAKDLGGAGKSLVANKGRDILARKGGAGRRGVQAKRKENRSHH